MSAPETSLWGGILTISGGVFCTFLAHYLNTKNSHNDDELIRELRREIKELKEK